MVRNSLQTAKDDDPPKFQALGRISEKNPEVFPLGPLLLPLRLYFFSNAHFGILCVVEVTALFLPGRRCILGQKLNNPRKQDTLADGPDQWLTSSSNSFHTRHTYVLYFYFMRDLAIRHNKGRNAGMCKDKYAFEATMGQIIHTKQMSNVRLSSEWVTRLRRG